MNSYWLVEGDGPQAGQPRRPPAFSSTLRSPDGIPGNTLRHSWTPDGAVLSVIGPDIDTALAEYWSRWNERCETVDPLRWERSLRRKA